MTKTSRVPYNCVLNSDSAIKYTKGKAKNTYIIVPDLMKAAENKECKDFTKSTFWKCLNKEIGSEYYDDTNIKKLKAWTYPKVDIFRVYEDEGEVIY